LEVKQSENIRHINFALIGSEKFAAKKLFFRVSVQNACEMNLVSLRFASFRFKANNFFGETGAPYSCPFSSFSCN
jgi:hypothetical protein